MNRYFKGAILATSVAGLMFSTACGGTDVKTDEVKCSGTNECKGQGACEGKDKDGKAHTCAGNNACKGQGWQKLSKADCDAKGGKVIE